MYIVTRTFVCMHTRGNTTAVTVAAATAADVGVKIDTAWRASLRSLPPLFLFFSPRAYDVHRLLRIRCTRGDKTLREPRTKVCTHDSTLYVYTIVCGAAPAALRTTTREAKVLLGWCRDGH